MPWPDVVFDETCIHCGVPIARARHTPQRWMDQTAAGFYRCEPDAQENSPYHEPEHPLIKAAQKAVNSSD